jgi:glycosyltransferase involved in cell wall biosynthesis
MLLTNSSVTLGDESVITLQATTRGKIAHILRREAEKLPAACYRRRERRLFSPGFTGLDITRLPAYREADLLHLHWINLGLVNLRHLRKVDKPIVWTIRDMWPMTGGCHYSGECKRYTSRCGKCPQLGSHSNHDLSRLVFGRKRRLLPRQAVYVGISNWVKETAAQSPLLSARDLRVIYNNVDSRDFFPVDPAVARKVLGIDTGKKIILAGAHALSDFYKGFDLYLKALGALEKNRYHLLFFGALEEAAVAHLGFDYTNLGVLHDTVAMRLSYSAADVFAAPSIMDAFGKTLAEAMACGTPVVCFDATGPRDIVDHRENGYRARPYEPEDLAAGIRWVLNAPGYEKLCRRARDKVLEHFDVPVIARQYGELYRELLNGYT